MINKSFKEIPVRGFEPGSPDEYRCYEIAQELGEENMNFILSSYNKLGLAVFERLYGLTKESPSVRDRKRYLNSLVQRELEKLNAR